LDGWDTISNPVSLNPLEAGKDIAVVAFGADFVFAALNQNVNLEQVADASNDYHGRHSISSSSQSKTTSDLHQGERDPADESRAGGDEVRRHVATVPFVMRTVFR
jgi:hypothetical protein